MFEETSAQLDELVEARRKEKPERRFSLVHKPKKGKKKHVSLGLPSSSPPEDAKDQPKEPAKEAARPALTHEAVDHAAFRASNPENHEELSNHAKSAVESHKFSKDEANSIHDEAKSLKDNPTAKSGHKNLKLFLGIAAGAAILGGAFVASPALGILIGSKLIDSFATPENASRILDHITGKSKEDSQEYEHNTPTNKANNDDEDNEDEHINHRIGDNIGDVGKDVSKEILSDEKSRKVVADAIKQHVMTPVSGKKEEIQKAYADRMEQFKRIIDDPNTGEEEREVAKENYAKARKILGDPSRQNDVLNNAKEPEEYDEEEEESDNEEVKSSVNVVVNDILSNLEQLTALMNFRHSQDGYVGGDDHTDAQKFGKGALNWSYPKGKIVQNPLYYGFKPRRKPTYACLKLVPACARMLKRWCEANGLKGVYPSHEFHITICYSRKPIDYKIMEFTKPKEVVPTSNPFWLLGREANKQYVVLKLAKGFPHTRFAYARSIGASHDFPDYMPHISLCPPGHGHNEDDLERFNNMTIPFPLLVDREEQSPLREDVKAEYELMEAAYREMVVAISQDSAYDILGQKLPFFIYNDRNSAKARQLRIDTWEADKGIKEGGSSKEERIESLQNASKPIFDSVWDYITRKMGSEKYNFNILQWYVGTKKNPASLKSLEDVGRVKTALELKERFKDTINKELDLQKYRDLNQITFTQLEDLADNLKLRTTKNQDKAGYEESLVKSNQANILYDDDEWKVVVPKSEEAARYYGRNTRWCTAADNDNMYLHYAEQGDLVVFIHKKDNQKFQMHFETDQYMNAKDEEVGEVEKLLLKPIFTKVYSKLKNVSNSALLYFYKNISLDMFKKIVNDNNLGGSALISIDNPTEEMQLVAVKNNYTVIRSIKNPSEKVQLATVYEEPYMLRYIESPTIKTQLQAVKLKPDAIRLINNPAPEVQIAAVTEEASAIDHIKNPVEEAQLIAIKVNLKYIKNIERPTQKVQEYCVRKGSNYFSWIRNPSLKTTKLQEELYLDS